MKNIIENLFGFLYTLSMGDYIFLSIAFLILVAFIYVIYLMKKEEENSINKSEINELESIKETIEKEYKPETIILTDYEKEQEESAIISYEELVNNKNKINISYDDEYESNTSDILVKKINITENNGENNKDSELHAKLMSYDKEEAFLLALKQLQQNLTS